MWCFEAGNFFWCCRAIDAAARDVHRISKLAQDCEVSDVSGGAAARAVWHLLLEFSGAQWVESFREVEGERQRARGTVSR